MTFLWFRSAAAADALNGGFAGTEAPTGFAGAFSSGAITAVFVAVDGRELATLAVLSNTTGLALCGTDGLDLCATTAMVPALTVTVAAAEAAESELEQHQQWFRAVNNSLSKTVS